MRKKKLIERVLSLILTLVILISSLSPSLLADNDTSETESGNGQALTNPVEGLLDPEPSNLPIVGADSYLIYDASSDTKLIGYQYDTLRAPAAITQIMTILLALEELELDDTITITKDMYESIPDDYVRIGFSDGEIVTVEQCLYACLLKSANDACMALAIKISGSESAFVKKMNERAEKLGCTSTHFTNSYGRMDSEHRTTCLDMSLILKEALHHPDFQEIATRSSFTIEPTNTYNDRRVLNNANRFVSIPATAYEYYIGGKTGFSTEASYTIIAGAEKDGRRLIGVLLGAGDAEKRYQTLIDLFEYCYTNYTTTMIDTPELNSMVQDSLTQIEHAISGTPLKVTNTELRLLECYSIETTLANGGYSNELDLSGMVIDPTADVQEFSIPIYRRFSNNESYRIGYYTVTITNPDSTTETSAETKVSEKKSLKTMIVPVIVGTILFIFLVFAIILLIKMIKKRKFNKNHRNPTIL
ncbi:MAG: D-alanyl-D-alanine carboxypeptidase [Clostridiales bacterium]|nr:D-alanyl-D-alanine carboxypeptidase [Clostridiales bacterium]MBP5417642.1 D-alanyl-D-alanine carboxypeptidase [Clostridiales bacterium]